MAAALVGTEYPVYRGLGGKVTKTATTIPELGPHDVLVRMTHSGVCHSDLVVLGWGIPAALGHEGVGLVEAVGEAVTSLKVGSRVGGGFHKTSCGHCRYCLGGNDIHCYERTIYGSGDMDNGTFGHFYIGKEGFVHPIPDELSSVDAAPLQCAGATVYSALVDTVKPGDRVGILGIGGLGHLAIQFAAKMGVEVVVISTTKEKQQEAMGFGASEFVLLGDVDKILSPLQVLVVTGARMPNWNKLLENRVLARNGTLVPLTAPNNGPLVLPEMTMFWDTYSVYTSLVASRARHAEMLQFAAKKGVKPVCQVFKFEGSETIEAIFRSLDENTIRYRAVLEF
ncbi:GroES-like protein [Thozetella sp. PMI_491]|nr:GroES-like protein [Thozetella sp. PMI_491]